MKKIRYKELDALRGIAVLMVVFFHYTMDRNEANSGFKLGTTGVDLFFIISGFVILLSLKQVKSSKQFFINRISRLYPTYWASVSFTFLLILIYAIFKNDFSNIDFLQYLGNMTMFQFYLKIPDIDNPYWTMIIEMLFYIFMLLLFHLKKLKQIHLIGFLITISIVTIVYFSFDNIWVKNIIYWFPLLQFWPLFFSGILFYKIITKSLNQKIAYLLIILCLVSQIYLFNFSGRSNSFINIFEYASMLSLYFILFTLFVNGKLNFIVTKTSLFFGKISFALYLIHLKISTSFIIPFLINKLNLNFWIACFVAIIVSIAIASFISYFIEIPFSKKMRNWLY